MRHPTDEEIAELAPLFAKADEQTLELQQTNSEVGMRVKRLRRLCQAGSDLVLDDCSGKWTKPQQGPQGVTLVPVETNDQLPHGDE